MFLEPPNETQLEFIKKEDFYQPAERLEEDAIRLIEWLSLQPHLPNITGESLMSFSNARANLLLSSVDCCVTGVQTLNAK